MITPLSFGSTPLTSGLPLDSATVTPPAIVKHPHFQIHAITVLKHWKLFNAELLKLIVLSRQLTESTDAPFKFVAMNYLKGLMRAIHDIYLTVEAKLIPYVLEHNL